MSNLVKRACLAAVLAALMIPASTRAQGVTSPVGQTPSQLPTVNEQVEVVATRLPEAPHDVPASIEVVSGDTLRAMGAMNLRDALSLAAGVEVAPGGDSGPAGSVPEFWGLREFDAFLLVVDGIPWGGAFNPALTTLSLRDVERVEVVRGSAPVTYGATSFVGVIHVVHKAGGASGRYASFRGGSYKSGSAAIDLAIPPFGSWESRLTVDVERLGFLDDRTSYARGHASYRAGSGGPDGRSWFMADINWLNQDPASPHPREGAALTTSVPTDANHNPAGAFLNDTRVTAAYGTERKVAGLNMRNTALADPFTTVDAGIGYRMAKWEARLDGHNLTDRRDPVSESELGDAHYYLMTARRVDVTFGVRF